MTYDARELSMQSGEPIEMYHFTIGSTEHHFTSAKSAITYDGNTYQPALIKRGSIDFTTEKGRNNLKLQTARDFAIADLFRVSPPSDVILLVVHRVHYGDSSGAVIWSGRVLNCEWSGSTASLNCEPVSSSLQRVGLRRLYQRQCPHVLYDSHTCKATKTPISATLSAVNGVLLTSSSFVSGLAGGYLEFGSEKRFISQQNGNEITITNLLTSLVVGSIVTVYLGCDHTINTCHNKFNNADNYGGMPHIPTKNPFTGAIF